MGVKSFIKKSVAFVSAMAMACSMVVMPAGVSYAAEGTDSLHLSKGIELQSDGNYKITLEAYATGQDTTTTTEESVPLDIVLVLDQSGSMDNSITSSITYTAMSSKGYSYTSLRNKEYYYKDGDNYYKVLRNYEGDWPIIYYLYYEKDNIKYYLTTNGITTTKPENITSYTTTIWTGVLYEGKATTTTRLAALKSAVTNFVASVKTNAEENEVEHKISVVGFASTKSSNQYKNTEILTVNGSSPVNYKTSDDNDSNFETALDNSLMDVQTDYAKINQAINWLDADGDTYSEYGMDMASRILEKHPVQEGEKRKQVIIMFTDGYTAPYKTDNIDYSMSDRAIANSKVAKDKKASVYTIGIFDNANPSMSIDDGYEYGSTDSSKQLVAANRYMNLVSSNYSSATNMSTPGTKVDEEQAIYYQAASNAGELENIFETIGNTVTNSGTSVTLTGDSVLRDVISDNFELPQGVEASSVKTYTATSKSVDDAGNITWNEKSENNDLTVNISDSKNQIDVSGFNYSDKYVTANHPGEKLIVEILVNGLKSGEGLKSNDTDSMRSGIYDGTKAVQYFTSPTVDIPEYSYVLDYGKKVTLPNADKNYSETMKINSTKAAPTTLLSIKKTYGTFTLGNDVISYQPEKINWDGFDSIFNFGKKVKASSDDPDVYEWSKVNVIPATSVYYEDDFASTETIKDGETGVKIVYGGNWSTAGEKQTTGLVTQDSSNSDYGWDELYKDDTAYSDGSAKYTNDINATATFTFTGTGVDVYSKTDGNTGMIRAQIYKEGSTSAMKTLYIDNISVSDSVGYYQIPTLSFDGLDYGTYKVVINAGGTGTGGGTTYYLDGIRVYNPLGITEEEIGSVAKDAYTNAGEYNATYKEVRDLLLNAGDFDVNGNVKGIVFIDKFYKTVGATTENIKTFEDYGPKNEVYLSEGQSIAFEVQSGYENLFIGAKSPTGNQITMTVSDINEQGAKDITFSHASDMYYKIDPPASTTTEGKNIVVITNNGKSLLSITKIRATGDGYNLDVAYTPALMSYVSEFALLDAAETDEKGMVVETPDTDVDVENPSEEEEDNNQDSTNNFWNQIVNAFKNWFKK